MTSLELQHGLSWLRNQNWQNPYPTTSSLAPLATSTAWRTGLVALMMRGGGSAREDPLQDVKEATADNSKSDTISVLEHLRGADYEVTWRLDNNGSQQSLM